MALGNQQGIPCIALQHQSNIHRNVFMKTHENIAVACLNTLQLCKQAHKTSIISLHNQFGPQYNKSKMPTLPKTTY